MILLPDEFQLFLSLQSALNNFIYAKLQEAKGLAAKTPFRDLPLEKQLEVRDAFAADHSLIDRFIVENPQNLSYDELEIVGSWRKMVVGKFYIVRFLKKHAVFLVGGNEATAYGVLGLTQPIEDIIGAVVPVMVDAILLPFQGRIVYDGAMRRFPIAFGPGIRRSLDDEYRDAKERCGIVTSLAPGPAQESKPKTKPRKRAAKSVE